MYALNILWLWRYSVTDVAEYSDFYFYTRVCFDDCTFSRRVTIVKTVYGGRNRLREFSFLIFHLIYTHRRYTATGEERRFAVVGSPRVYVYIYIYAYRAYMNNLK